MTTWIVFFRGINVGGNNKLPMKDLQKLLEANGYTQVRTYIQSGNVVLNRSQTSAGQLENDLGQLIKENFGFQPQVMALSIQELEKAIANNPYRILADENPKSVHVFFLEGTPKNPKLDALSERQANGEDFSLQERFFYLYAPEGIGKSKLAASIERRLGVNATARNWRTATKMLELARQ